MKIETKADLAAAGARLARRTQDSLAQFVLSLAFDPGPVGEQVRTFIVGDDVELASASLKERIDRLQSLNPRGSGKRFGDETVAQRLEYVLDAVETQVLPASPKIAFDLLVLLVERDSDAMENCGDDDSSVATAFDRAADLIAKAAHGLPEVEVTPVLERLVGKDDYGARRSLAAVLDLQCQRD